MLVILQAPTVSASTTSKAQGAEQGVEKPTGKPVNLLRQRLITNEPDVR